VSITLPIDYSSNYLLFSYGYFLGLSSRLLTDKVVYSFVLTNAKTPLSRKEVESHFEGELLKK